MGLFNPGVGGIAASLSFAVLLGSQSVAYAAPDSTVLRESRGADSLQWLTFVPTNSQEENYLRYLQISGAVRTSQWTVRGLSPHETRRMTIPADSHPWRESRSFTARARRTTFFPLEVGVRYNSAFPYGSNDGPVWSGRGVTGSVSAGVAFLYGPLSLVLAPVAFSAQNSPFALLDNGMSGALSFGDGLYPEIVDRPQRFGDERYARIDPGNSTLRLDAGMIAVGISTANMAWGPLERYPYVLGSNAPGIFHGFAGTSRPVDVFIGSVHTRVVWGRLDQSAYSPVEGKPEYISPAEPGTRRFASGLVLSFSPRGARGLEIGVARFFHSPWPDSGIPSSYFTKPFEGFLKSGLRGSPEFADPNSTADNQLISGFVRWAFPSAGFEMYGEYGREDHSWDKRDFVQEPDHSRSYGLGFRKTLRLRPERMDGLSVEMINFQQPHLARGGRGEGGVYVHGVMRQGHTHRGQLLGADVGVGDAAGSTIRWDRYVPGGRASLALHRTVRQERGGVHLGGTVDPNSSDIQYALEAERTRRYRGIEFTAGGALIRGLNRDFRRDYMGFSATLRAKIPIAP